ncbi:MAG TPA: DUF4253 domain-containing protein [Tepidisphaeraceae bacterium]|nr:DUF4253 domain-containing protein [Tepidisphaeraceae bacterium]
MDSLKQILQSSGIACADWDVLTSTDRGDILFFTSAGGKSAIDLWQQLMDLAGRTKHWPVLLGEEEDIANHRELSEMNNGLIQETLDFANKIEVPSWFALKEAERLEDFKKYNPGEDPANFLTPVGDWPDSIMPSNNFFTPFDTLSRKPLARIVMGLIPTTICWESPAFLRLGGWNECPDAALHCAVQKYWQQQYDAVIVAATHDVVEMKVRRPPMTREAAMKLAKEQFIYCQDIVEQGTQTLSRLAAGLLNGSAWFFWWD